MWSLLALFTAASGAVPPFQLAAMTFAIGALVGFVWIAAGGRWRDLASPGRSGPLGVARALRLPRALFHRAPQRAAGRGGADRLSLAAA